MNYSYLHRECPFLFLPLCNIMAHPKQQVVRYTFIKSLQEVPHYFLVVLS